MIENFRCYCGLLALACGGNVAESLPQESQTQSPMVEERLVPPSEQMLPQETENAPPPVGSSDTCEDNPLLAICRPEAPVRTDNEAEHVNLPVDAVENILQAMCGACHGSQIVNAIDAEAGTNFIDDVEKLLVEGYIIPGDADNSLVVQVMRDGTMPPPNYSGARPSDADIDAVAAYVDNPVFF